MSAILLQTSLEAIDKPFMPSSASGNAAASGSGNGSSPEKVLPPPPSHPQTRRISPLPPMPTVPRAGPSKGPQRYLFIAVRRGHRPGVYTEWTEAEVQLSNHPDPQYKTFSTRLAAEAFIAGWDGAGRHSLPRSSPRTLREHLAMSFPSSVASPSSGSRRQSYHQRILAAAASSSTEELHDDPMSSGGGNDNGAGSSPTARPALGRRSASYRDSMVKVSSPLRMQLDEQDGLAAADGSSKTPRRAQSYMSFGGLLSPPQSPVERPSSVMDRQRPTKSRDVSEGAPWSASQHREFRKSKSTGLLSPPASPVLGSTDSGSQRRSPPAPSGLWADCKPATPSPLAPGQPSQLALGPPVDLLGANGAPKRFSRAGLKKSGVVMPVAAPRTNSQSSLSSLASLSKRASSSSLFLGSNSSLSSLASSSGSGQPATSGTASSSRPGPKRQSSTPLFSMSSTQDRLSSLAETSRRELEVDEHGFLALQPPRASFMRRQQSNSSLDSTASAQSMSSLTSATSAASSTVSLSEDHAPKAQYFTSIHAIANGEGGIVGGLHELAEIPESHEVVAFDHIISCTKSDGDADGSSEGGSMKSGWSSAAATTKKEKKSGGLFKRLSKALKLEKKVVAGQENRRPSM